jgi:dienelactone hydrolase
MERVARTVAGIVHSLTPDHHHVTQEMVARPGEEEPLGILVEQLHATMPSMTYQGERGADWRQWQANLRDKLWELLGMQYERTSDVQVEALETSLISGVERTKILMTAADGLKIPGYIMAPVDLQEPLPAILLYPGHGTIAQVAGVERSAERSSALALAQAGYITMTIEGRGFGELGPNDHVALDNIARLIGRTWLGMVLEDGLRALDYLQTRPYVKPKFMGATGLSLGAGQALFTAALDPRITTVVIQNYVGGDMDPVSVLGHGCDFVPRLRCYADMSDVARLLVPRSVLYAYPKGRGVTSVAHAWFDRMRPLYEILRCPDRTRFVEHDHGNDYDAAIAHAWFDRWLVDEEDPSCLLFAPGEDPTED